MIVYDLRYILICLSVIINATKQLSFQQMLKAAANVAPRGVYVCGNTSTTSGLTVTLVKEGSAGEYALEAGALVLGDQGDKILFSNNMCFFAYYELCDLKFHYFQFSIM